MKHRQFATAWVTEGITWHEEPMQVLAYLMSSNLGITIYHHTCRSDGPPEYAYYKEEWGMDDKDIALAYWDLVKIPDSEVRKRIEQLLGDQLGFGIPF